MGTRSLTFVYDVDDKLVCMYRQWDGYPSCHGAELAEFLAGGKLVNGLGLGDNAGLFNGMDCLAAQLVAHFKKGAGGIYLLPTRTEDADHNYEYHVHEVDGSVVVEVVSGAGTLFLGNVAEFTEFCKNSED